MRKKILSILTSCALVFTALVSLSALSFSASAVTYTADPTWYEADKSVLEINDIPDFVAFMNKLDELGTGNNGSELGAAGNLAAISWDSGVVPFTGQTILLNRDIALNPGITFSASGPSDSSAFSFNRTQTQIGFGGIFDGQGHTISGLYINAAKGASGSIFGVAGAATKGGSVAVKNLQIKNSLIVNSHQGVASIFASVAFNCNATIENVFSNAFIRCDNESSSADSNLNFSIVGANMGGLCATVGGNLTIKNSVFAGTLANGGTSTLPRKIIGGLVGNTTNKTINQIWYTAKLTVENSGYYGTYVGNGVYIGKLMGQQTAGSSVTVKNSVFAGSMKSTTTTAPGSEAATLASTYYVGRLIGNATSNFTINVSGSVATPSFKKTSTSVTKDYNSANTANSGSSISLTALSNLNSLKGNVNLNSVVSGLGNYWTANVYTAAGYPLPTALVNKFGVDRLKASYVTDPNFDAEDKRPEVLASLGALIDNSDGKYTDDSYENYSAAYEKIKSDINGAKTLDALLAINVSALKSEAEGLLVTVLSAKQLEFMTRLGEKIENANGFYTEDTYSAYSSAYDKIYSDIEGAASVDALESIDVSARKQAAEELLEYSLEGYKAQKLESLGEKKENRGEYTDESYESYEAKYREVCDDIAGVTTMEELNAINLDNIKAELEEMLLTHVEAKQKELIASIEAAKKENNGEYYEESFGEYLGKLDAIKTQITSTETLEELEALDVESLISEAESVLISSLKGKKNELIESLGDKIADDDDFIDNSYEEYSDAYDEILDKINSAGSLEELEDIDLNTMKTEAEGKLKTELSVKKAELIEALGERLDNDDKRYSDESYEEYLSLYNVILNTIQNATDIAVLDMLDVDAYRTNAESKLVLIKTPETEESDTDGDADEGETGESKESESESESEGTEPETEKKSKKKGCRSSAGITSLAIVTLISAAGVTLRKIRRRD